MPNLIKADVRMTSLEIAEIVGKKHFHVMRDIRKEIDALGDEVGASIFGLTTYTDKSNRETHCYQFGKDGAMQLALKYDAKTRHKVIKRIEELESQPQQLPMNNTKLLLETALKHETKIEEIESDVTYLKGSMRIDSLQQQEIQATAKRAVIQALGGGDSVAYHEMSKKVFSAFWREFKQYFKVPRYGDIPKVKFDEAIRFIELWRPTTSLQIKIDQCNSQMTMV